MHVALNAVFLTSERFGGTWTYTYNLARALSSLNDRIDLTIIAHESMAHRFRELPAHVVTAPFRSRSPISRVMWEQSMLPALLDSLSPDIFHSTGNVLPVRIRIPSVLTIHDFQYKYFPQNFSWTKRIYLNSGMRSSIRRATKVICVSEETKRNAAVLCDADKGKLRVVHEAGLVPGELEERTEESVLRSRYDLNAQFILYAASGFPHKNLHRLIKAFARIADDIPHHLVIAGELFGRNGELENAIETQFGDGSSRVKVIGFVPREDLLGLYSIADCYILPSLFEGFGISLLEAMECECPVIASNTTALPEVGGDAALYCDPENIGSIADSLKQVLTDKRLRSHLVRSGMMRARQFSWKKVADETAAVYQSAIESRK